MCRSRTRDDAGGVPGYDSRRIGNSDVLMIGPSPLEEAQVHAVASLVASATVFAALTGLGRLPGRFIDRLAGDSGLLRLPVSLAMGWAIAAVVSAAGAPFGADQWLIARAILGLGLASLLPWGARRDGLASEDVRLLRDLAVVLVLAAPLALLASRTPAMMFDEFAHWLLATRYLVEHGTYWLFPDWIGAAGKPGYPNGSTVIGLLASRIDGGSVEAYFKTFLVFAMASFGLVIAFLTEVGLGFELPGLIALGTLIALANPFFDPRIALTSYTDAPTGLLLAVAGITSAAGIGAGRAGSSAEADGWFARGGLCCAALVMLRTTNVVLVGALGLACAALTFTGRWENPRRPCRWAALFALPSLVGLGVWHYYLTVARIGPDLMFRPLASWDWGGPITVARSLFIGRLLDNPWRGGLAALLACVALGVFVRSRHLVARHGARTIPPGALLGIVAIVSGCFVVFLAVAYMGYFSGAEVAQAASAWRYLTELGPLLLAGLTALAAVLAYAWSVRRAPLTVRVIGVAAVITTLSLPILARRYYALDCRYPDVIAARLATAQLAPQLDKFAPTANSQRRLAVVHPTMGDWMAHAIAYDLRWPVIDRSIEYRTGSGDARSAEQWAWDTGADALLDLTPLDRDALAAGATVPSVTLVARPASHDERWARLAVTAPRSLPPCGGL